MIQIDGLAEVVLNVRDASRAVAFYGDLLGLERMTPADQPGPIFAPGKRPIAFPRPAPLSPGSATSGTAHAAPFGADHPGSRVRRRAGNAGQRWYRGPRREASGLVGADHVRDRSRGQRGRAHFPGAGRLKRCSQEGHQQLPRIGKCVPIRLGRDDPDQAPVLLVALKVVVGQSHHIAPRHQRFEADRRALG